MRSLTKDNEDEVYLASEEIADQIADYSDRETAKLSVTAKFRPFLSFSNEDIDVTVSVDSFDASSINTSKKLEFSFRINSVESAVEIVKSFLSGKMFSVLFAYNEDSVIYECNSCIPIDAALHSIDDNGATIVVSFRG
jgi:hypothetical protein